jgi:hypothetical protein
MAQMTILEKLHKHVFKVKKQEFSKKTVSCCESEKLFRCQKAIFCLKKLDKILSDDLTSNTI